MVWCHVTVGAGGGGLLGAVERGFGAVGVRRSAVGGVEGGFGAGGPDVLRDY